MLHLNWFRSRKSGFHKIYIAAFVIVFLALLVIAFVHWKSVQTFTKETPCVELVWEPKMLNAVLPAMEYTAMVDGVEVSAPVETGRIMLLALPDINADFFYNEVQAALKNSGYEDGWRLNDYSHANVIVRQSSQLGLVFFGWSLIVLGGCLFFKIAMKKIRQIRSIREKSYLGDYILDHSISLCVGILICLVVLFLFVILLMVLISYTPYLPSELIPQHQQIDGAFFTQVSEYTNALRDSMSGSAYANLYGSTVFSCYTFLLVEVVVLVVWTVLGVHILCKRKLTSDDKFK